MWLKRILTVLFPSMVASCTPTGWSVQERANLGELESLFTAVVGVEHATVVIQVIGTEKFIQFDGGSEEVWMDFPLVTAEQQSQEEAIRHFAKVRALQVLENPGSDGSLFLDVVLPANPDELARHTRDAFAELMNVGGNAEIEVLGGGFSWEASRHSSSPH
jgi:hypothetical protein